MPGVCHTGLFRVEGKGEEQRWWGRGTGPNVFSSSQASSETGIGERNLRVTDAVTFNVCP